MLVIGFASLVFLVALFPAAQATPPPSGQGIPPVVWELVALTGADGVQVDIDDPTRYTVQFLPEGRLTAKLDCNQGAAGFTASDGIIEITQMAATLALCEPDSHDGTFQVILQGVTSYEIDPDGFLLLSGDEGTLRLRPALTGVLWEWQEFEGSDGEVVQPDDPSRYTIEFLPEGNLAIQADCNRATGTYTVDGPTIDLRVGAVTRMACPAGSLMERFLRALDDGNSHVFRAGGLFLALPVDSGILEFQPTYVAPEGATPVAG